ncbi:sulfite exporter TauE/SafE family protein [Saccharobesus litoralis]|uniref:Probable membrane transporter protein n=1 Tax=Saccharobesus litoralis TaxID=2172099 RepID=A0A2S0VN01_9ALTE|nr:sulfite exporter TauE/SafE family protein [Saccharobesus litoralis]AWB65549.1 sulfite exporter TauE/SafE family protein [Saccharobesus litoralis]
MSDWIYIYVLLIMGACLQNTIGFGLGLLCAPVLMHIAPELVPVPMILSALLITSIITYGNIRDVDFKQTTYSTLGGTVGIVIASVVMLNVQYEVYRMIFGGLILLGVGLSVVGLQPKVMPSTSLIAGGFAGFMGTLTAAGGAPMGLLYQNAKQKSIRANLSIFFIYINGLAFLTLAVTGLVTKDDLINFAKCAPAILVGLGLSYHLNRYINGDVIKPIILFVAFLAGASIFVL